MPWHLLLLQKTTSEKFYKIDIYAASGNVLDHNNGED